MIVEVTPVELQMAQNSSTGPEEIARKRWEVCGMTVRHELEHAAVLDASVREDLQPTRGCLVQDSSSRDGCLEAADRPVTVGGEDACDGPDEVPVAAVVKV
jgi:hypothetical protein